MKKLLVVILSSLIASGLSFAISGNSEVTILAGIECAFLSGMLLLFASQAKWRYSPYLHGAVAVIAVTCVTLFTGAAHS